MLTSIEIRKDDPFYAMRTKASVRLEEIGFPTRKTEVYRYIKLKKMYEREWDIQNTPIIESGKCEGVDVVPLNQALKTFGGYFQHRFSTALKEETDAFAMANAAYHQDGLFVYVPPHTIVKTPLHLDYRLDGAFLIMPRIHIFVGACSTVNIVVKQIGNSKDFFLNSVIDFHIEENACVNLIQSSKNPSGYVFEAVRATLKRDAFFNSVSLTDGAECERQDYRISLMQEGACAHLNGVCRLTGNREAHVNLLMEHIAPNCRSRQLFKGVLEGISRSSFEGKITVKKEAQQTDAFQLNNYLLLDEHAQAYSKPNLEIFADDVKASHGATIGQLNEDELFYMRTRGISQTIAKKLLIESFCQEVLDCIPRNINDCN